MPAPAVVDNISELSALFKTVYSSAGVEQQQNLAAMIWKRLSASSEKFGGNHFEFPARMGNTQSVGARGDRQSLPEPIANLDVTARVRHKYNYGTADITGPDIEKGKGNVNAFVNSLTDKMKSLIEMVTKDMNMQCYLDGTGVRATMVAAPVGTQLPVDRVKYLRVGMHVNVIASDGVTIRGGNGDSDRNDGAGQPYNARRYTILAIDPATLRVTLGAGDPIAAVVPTGAADDDFIVRHKSVGRELTGFDAIIDDGIANPGAVVLQDIDRVANPGWRAKVLESSSGARDISLQLMQIAMDAPEATSGRRITDVLGSFNARDRYLQLLVPQKRFQDLKLDGGFQVLEYNGRDFVIDVDCQDDTVYFMSRETIQKYGLFDLAYVEQTGGILKHDSLSSGDVFYLYCRALCNLGTTQANGNSKITDIIVDSEYTDIWS